MTAVQEDIYSLIFIAIFAVISFVFYRRWKRDQHADIFLWPVIGITGVLAIAFAVQIIGLFIVQKYELRKPLAWLLCLVLVVAINMLFGITVKLIIPASLQLIYNPSTSSIFASSRDSNSNASIKLSPESLNNINDTSQPPSELFGERH
jgi:di/tricarboxylate transporter